MTLTEIIRNKTGMDFPSLNLKGLKLFGENLWKSPLGDLFQAGDIFEYEGMVLLYKEMKWAFVDVGLGKHVKIADPVLEIVGYSPEADVENLTLKLMDCIKVNSDNEKIINFGPYRESDGGKVMIHHVGHVPVNEMSKIVGLPYEEMVSQNYFKH